jgi:spore coat protein U-like protein
MKRLRVLAAVACLLVPAAACAAGGYTLAIGATVLSKSNCKFTSAAGSTLAFGGIDPSGAANATASTNLVINCAGSAATAAYSISSDDGLWSTGPAQPRLRHAITPTAFLAYTLNTPMGGTTPKNLATTITITGTITAASYQNALGGAYADTVVLTLSP